MKKPPLVEVTWTDACDRNLEVPLSVDEIRSRVHLKKGRTVRGLLVYQDEEKTALAHDFDPPDPGDEDQRPSVGNFTVIPTGWITKTRYIERGPKRRKEKAHEGTTASNDQ